MTRTSTTAPAIRWRRSGTSCRCFSRSTRSRSRSRRRPTARRSRASPRAPSATSTAACIRCRLLALSGRPRGEHADVVRRQRLVGPGVRQRLPRDRPAAMADRRKARAGVHRRGRLGRQAGRPVVEHRPPVQGGRGAGLGHAAGDAAVRTDEIELRARAGAQVPRVGQHGRLQRSRRAVRGQQPQPDADRLRRGPADLRAGGAVQRDRHRRPTASAQNSRRPTRCGASATCWTSRRSTTRSTCSGCSRCTRATTTARCTRSPPTTRATRKHARATPKACTCCRGTAKRCRQGRAAGDAADARSDDQPVRMAGRYRRRARRG